MNFPEEANFEKIFEGPKQSKVWMANLKLHGHGACIPECDIEPRAGEWPISPFVSDQLKVQIILGGIPKIIVGADFDDDAFDGVKSPEGKQSKKFIFRGH